MTLLSIIQDAADEIRTTRPTSVIPNTDPDVENLLRLANRVGESLMKKAAWQALRKEQTFSALGQEEQTAILPSDFDRFVSESFWNRTSVDLLSGPVGSVRWQGMKANSYSDTEHPLFIHRGGSVHILPAPTAGDALAFEYVSNQWCQSSGGTGQSAWAANDDVSVIDDELMTLGIIAAYLYAQGLPQAPGAYEIYDRHCNILLDNDQPDSTVMVAADIFSSRGGRHFTGDPPVTGNSRLI